MDRAALIVLLLVLGSSLAAAQSIGVSPDKLIFLGSTGRQIRIYNFNNHDVEFDLMPDGVFNYQGGNLIEPNSFKDIILEPYVKSAQKGTLIVRFFSGTNLITAAGVKYDIKSTERPLITGYFIKDVQKSELGHRAVGIVLMVLVVFGGLLAYSSLKRLILNGRKQKI